MKCLQCEYDFGLVYADKAVRCPNCQTLNRRIGTICNWVMDKNGRIFKENKK